MYQPLYFWHCFKTYKTVKTMTANYAKLSQSWWFGCKFLIGFTCNMERSGPSADPAL